MMYHRYMTEMDVCDQCMTSVKQDDIVWHCQEKKEELHKFGFGICNNCIIYNVYDQKRYLEMETIVLFRS